MVKLPNDPFSHHFSFPSNLDGEALPVLLSVVDAGGNGLVSWLLDDYCWLLSLSTT